MTELTLEMLRAELAPLHAELISLRAEQAIIRARVDGLLLIGEAIETLRRDSRLLRMARTNITAGEVDAMHTDIDAVQSRQMNLETRIATLERLISK